MLGIAPGGPHLIAPRSLVGGEAQEKMLDGNPGASLKNSDAHSGLLKSKVLIPNLASFFLKIAVGWPASMWRSARENLED